MEITLQDRVAVITGGGAGIGRGIVDAYRSLGAKVVIVDNDPAKISRLRDEFGEDDALAIETDVTDLAQVNAMVDAVRAKFGRIDVLVNNAGHHLGLHKTLEATTDEDIAGLYAINLHHLFVVTRAALPLIRLSKYNASIINVSSIEAFRGNPYNIVYTALKHAVTGFTRGLALELAPDNIRVNAIAPETTDSEQLPVDAMVKPEFRERVRTLPLGRYGTPADHAGAAVYFATDMSTWVTGTTAHVDGGGLAAAGFQRTPEGKWTIGPLVTGEVFAV